MDIRELELRVDGLAEAVFNAQRAQRRLLAAVLDRLVANATLSAVDLGSALAEEIALIEALRDEGLECRLAAVASEQLVADLRHSFEGRRRGLPPLDAWRLDPTDPTWSRPPVDPNDREPANQP